jgi:AraC family transcriptional regulator
MQFGGTVLFERSPATNVRMCADTSGDIVERRELLNVNLRETVYRPGLRLSPHMHANSYLSFIIEGHYTETYQGNSATCGAGSVRFLPAFEVHSNAYEGGARCLLVELQPDSLDRLRDHTHILEHPGEVGSPRAALLARRLYSEFRQRDAAASIAIEGLVLEILAESARSTGAAGRHIPKWLMRARDMIQAQFLNVPSLTEIARAAGVHPVHLSREFRRYFDCTVGDYMRKLRVEHASHLLANTDTPLAEIAAACGFADQSHFSSTFKRAVGQTPSRYREMQP